MMLKYILPLALLSMGAQGFAKDAPVTEAPAPVKVEKDLGAISETLGHLIAKNLETLGFQFDMKKVIKGLEDSLAGKSAPLSEADCVAAITAIQEEQYAKLAETNLTAAASFMEKNVLEAGIVQVQKGKLHYRVTQAGTGTEVQPSDSPVIRYTGRFLDGKVFGQSKADEVISLEDTIPGFKQGIVGMKEGEKRTLFIHPDLGYGTSSYLPPNTLLTFEIELVKANSPKEAKAVLGDEAQEISSESAQ